MFVLLLLIGVPLLELALLLEVGEAIGAGPTISLVILTGIVGVALARAQGLGVMLRMRQEMASGQPPTASVVEGGAVFLAGVLLLVPGILTDLLGVALLVPPLRRAILAAMGRRLANAAREGRVNVTIRTFGSGPRPPGAVPPPQGDIIDVEPTRVEGGEDRS